MRITGIETFLMSAGAPVSATGGAENSAGTVATATGLPFGTTRHWLFIEVHTDQGITGVGEGSGWPLVVEAAVRDLAPMIVGEDPPYVTLPPLPLKNSSWACTSWFIAIVSSLTLRHVLIFFVTFDTNPAVRTPYYWMAFPRSKRFRKFPVKHTLCLEGGGRILDIQCIYQLLTSVGL